MNQQELDLLEVGHEPAKCLKGENSHPQRDKLIAGRAHRGLAVARRERNRHQVFGRRPNWFYEALLNQLEDAKAYEERRVKVRDKKIAALERQQAQLRSILRIP